KFQTVSGVFYGPHGGTEHFWIRDPMDLVDILGPDRRPVAYISRGKHANYPV
ncbi:unnamed protein product, partial [Choristocarpus tenellus]